MTAFWIAGHFIKSLLYNSLTDILINVLGLAVLRGFIPLVNGCVYVFLIWAVKCYSSQDAVFVRLKKKLAA